MTKRRKCPKCGKSKPADQFSCEWCDFCYSQATDNIMRMIGHTIVFAHKGLNDDAEETWQAAWDWALDLPADYPDYAELSEVLSNICPVPEMPF